MHFSDLRLIEPLLRAVADEGYTVPTPIQVQAIPHVLEGRDLLACAQTGTGKTAAFALPILQRLSASVASAAPAPPAPHSRNAAQRRRPIRVLVLTPTRELAAQIGESFTVYGRHLHVRNTVIFGGVGQGNQERALAAGPDVLVATPGRLLDLCSQRLISLRDLEVFVLDEADRMLDMGFIHDVRRVIALIPERRQTLFFSATMPPEIIDLSSRILVDPARVAVTPIASTAEKIEQHVYFVDQRDKRALLEHVLGDPAIERALVFTRTKHGANRVAEGLVKARIGAEAIHGNKSQGARERALASFKRGTTRVLVATDIAARGLDIDAVTHIINFDLPDVPESYVHRIGRTARAGASGIAYSFCDGEERAMLVAIERLIRMRIAVVEDHPLRASSAARAAEPRAEGGGRDPGPRAHRGGGHRGDGQGPRRAFPEGAARSHDRGSAPRVHPAGPRLGGAQTTPAVAGAPPAAGGSVGHGRSRRFSSRSERRYVSS
jgi:ATP-dependent RNA helicase RhlE